MSTEKNNKREQKIYEELEKEELIKLLEEKDKLLSQQKELIDALQKELEEKEKTKAEYLDYLKRLQADFDNFRRRVEKEKKDIIQFANEELIKKFLNVLDNLERAEDAAKKTNDIKALIEGIDAIIKQFKKILEDEGVKPIKSVGEKFDPNLHHAMAKVETNEYPDETVIEELQKGYYYKSRVLRPSLVKVSKAIEKTEKIKEEEQEEDSE